jgi:gliding motility-associated-like protein
MKKFFITVFLLFSLSNAFAAHIKGGFFTYEYIGHGIANPDYLRYKISLTVYMSCNPNSGQLTNQINFTIFEQGFSNVVANPAVTISRTYNLSKETDDPCISLDQRGCYYTVVIYELNSIELAPSTVGYTISYQRCCRIANMQNVTNSETVGNTYSISIPGTNSIVPYANKNSSPNFPINDTGVVCGGSYFEYPFSASDKDGDQLTYSLCAAFIGGSSTQPSPNPAAAPPYPEVYYTSPYSGFRPMGPNVTINPLTGLISGIAPSPNSTGGEFVITVCVTETRGGKYVSETRKELHIQVKDCAPVVAKLAPKPITCDGFNVNFSNSVFNPSGTLFNWDFGNPLSGSDNNSTSSDPAHIFSDTGIYKVKLNISLGGFCANSDSIIVRVYPGFFPDFKADGPFCKGIPFKFTDITTTKYGVTTGWRWNFGNTLVNNDTSIFKNPSYTYINSGNYIAQLIVSNTFGCTDTVKKNIKIVNGPDIGLNTHDTLICSIDTLQLKTSTIGNFVWSPNYNISSLISANPFISPDVPTKYFVSFSDSDGCKNTDSVFVDVKQFASINLGNDTTICRPDGFTINTISDALNFVWSPSTYLSSSTIKNPIVTPLVPSITYTVVGNIGKCQSQDQITIKSAPTPIANAGKDTIICFGDAAQLHATGGNIYTWTPTQYLTASNIANPKVIGLTSETQFIVEVRDTLGCIKTSIDSIIVSVDAIFKAYAGRDTSVVINEPIVLNGTGGVTYLWQPASWLSNPTIANPTATPQENITYQLTAISKGGCKAMDEIQIKVYKIAPGFYVPSGFTPNNDGNNDVIRPILMGMRSLKLFRVYNRWGQLLFTTSEKGKGWDGTFKGSQQDPGTFVWIAEGVTYLGENIKKQGTVVLLR